MNHEEWAAEFNSLFLDDALSGTSRIAALEKLLASTATLARTAIGDWHMQQVSSAIAMAHEDCGNKSDAANVYAQLAETMESQIRSMEVATGFAYASAALLQFDLAQDDLAVETAKNAFKCFGRTADPSLIYCELIARMRSFMAENREHCDRSNKTQ